VNIKKPITVLLAEDHLMVREGLRSLLSAENDIVVIAETNSGHQTVEQTLKLRPTVVVMDVAMPQLNGLEATRQILKEAPETKILFLSAHSDDAYVETAMKQGAMGYLIKQASFNNLTDAIRDVCKGKKVFSPDIAARFNKRHRKTPDRSGVAKEPKTALTSRETEVLQQIAEGFANKQIAAALSISIKTVEKHRSSLMRKLDIHETASLTRYAIQSGIIECSVQPTTL